VKQGLEEEKQGPFKLEGLCGHRNSYVNNNSPSNCDIRNNFARHINCDIRKVRGKPT